MSGILQALLASFSARMRGTYFMVGEKTIMEYLGLVTRIDAPALFKWDQKKVGLSPLLQKISLLW
jgi:hypothetical protein